MSGGATAVWVGAAIAGAGTYMNYKAGREQKAMAERVAEQNQAAAAKQEKAADEATNRANQKRANTNAALDSATQAGRAGASGTMLTGPQGIDPAALSLGKNTLLGS